MSTARYVDPRAFLGAALILAAALSAHGNAFASPVLNHADGHLVEVSVLVDGAPAPLYLRPGQWDREYFQAFKKKNYALQVTNNSGKRIAVLITVDGLNVVDGKKSKLANYESMYVMDPNSTATIRGWRTSIDDVRRFVFVDEEHSYSARTGQANGDMGWIRVLSFREQPKQTMYRDRIEPGPAADQQREGAKAPAPAPTAQAPQASGSARSQGSSEIPSPQSPNDAAPGTGWGEHRYDPVTRTQFNPVANATDHIVLRYEYASGLHALGIDPRQPRVWERERGQVGFAPPPTQ